MSKADETKRRQFLHPGEYGHLSDLRIGQEAEVLDFHDNNAALRRHLLDMGITKGVVVKVKKEAPFGNPMVILIRGYELAMRREEVKGIDVRVLGKDKQ